MKTLVAYFSAENGATRAVAEELAKAIDADLFEIVPEKPYTAADLYWPNPLARCNREHREGKDVPVAGTVKDFAQYDRVLLGFPIWYGYQPLVVSTFCKAYDWSGKAVYAFATSGGSGIGRTAEKLRPFVPGAASVDAKLVRSSSDVTAWLG